LCNLHKTKTEEYRDAASLLIMPSLLECPVILKMMKKLPDKKLKICPDKTEKSAAQNAVSYLYFHPW